MRQLQGEVVVLVDGNGHGCKLLPISPPPGGRGTTAALRQGGAGGDGGVG